MSCEIWSEILAFIGLIIALVAVLLTLWQNTLTRRAVQSQVLLTLKERAREANYFDGVAAIRALKSYGSYEAYLQNEPEAVQKTIYDTVDFLNFVAHLVDDKFLSRDTAWNYYFHAYRISNEKLLTWWMTGIRQDRFQGFTGFEKMCRRIGNISEDAIAKHEARYLEG